MDKLKPSEVFLVKVITKESYQDLFNAGWIESYLFFEEKEGLFLLFKEIQPEYTKLLEKQDGNINFVEERVYGDKSVLEFVIPTEIMDDYNIFKKGKYSSMSDNFKNNYPKKMGRDKSFWWKIFDKDESLKNKLENHFQTTIPDGVDYFEKPNFRNETLIIDNI